MILGHKIKLCPNKTQIDYFEKACGIARFTYNWGLEHAKKQDKLNIYALKKEFNTIKKTEFPWIYEIHKDANQQAFRDLITAYNKFFAKQTKYPKYKKKHHTKTFSIGVDRIKFDGKYVTMPRIGKIKLTEELRYKGKLINTRVSNVGGDWFLSVAVDIGEHSKARLSDDIIGIDIGIKTAIVTSKGEFIDSPKPLKNNLQKLKRLDKRLAKKQKGGKNREKAKRKRAKLHYRIACIRNDFINKVTTKLCRENQTIVIEDLNIAGWMKNHCWSRAVIDIGIGDIKHHLKYKSIIYKNTLIIANRWFPSTKTCSNCGCIKDITLAERTYSCRHCGFTIDRDLNAAINLSTLGLRGSHACGHDTSTSCLTEASIMDEAGTLIKKESRITYGTVGSVGI